MQCDPMFLFHVVCFEVEETCFLRPQSGGTPLGPALRFEAMFYYGPPPVGERSVAEKSG